MQAIAVVLDHVIALVDRAEAVVGDKDEGPATGPEHAPNILRECMPPDDVLEDLPDSEFDVVIAPQIDRWQCSVVHRNSFARQPFHGVLRQLEAM